MNKLTVFVIISIFVIICLSKIYIVYCKNNLEHLTVNSDEAIQNVASLYNTDQLTIGKINATGIVKAEQLIDASLNSPSVKAYIDDKIAAINTKIAATDAKVASDWNYVIGPLTEWIKAQDNMRVTAGGWYWQQRPDGSNMWTHPTRLIG
jgi:hypothetical protein